MLVLTGCSGEPSETEVRNAQAFEALLTAIALRDGAELDRDARVIEARYTTGAISDASMKALRRMIDLARTRQWSQAEAEAYRFRERCGSRGSFFR